VSTLVAAAGAVVLVAGVAGLWRACRRSRVSPAEAERRRRIALAATGKLADGTLHEAAEGLLIYAYDVGGVAYTAAQDISGLSNYPPSADEFIFGAVLVKYDPKNPANSIVVSEQWTGFRTTASQI
jgi:hypothetical protein